MDMLDLRKSSIPHAGRGAFAKDSFALGDRILALPLLQISRNALDIYATMNDGGGEELYSRQLLLNYCLGHKNSSVLLMPYSSTAHFINHATNANAKLVWATSESDPTGLHQDEWLLLSAEEVLEKQHTGLLMHVIATRSIAKDEEITIDYGPGWVDAWTKHAEHWVEHAHHVTAAELNESDELLRTIFEQSYPSSITTACHYKFSGTYDEANAKNNPNNHVGDNLVASQIESIEENASTWVDHGDLSTFDADHFRPCKILARHISDDDGEYIYTVEMENRNDHREFDKIPEAYRHFVKSVPRRAILFVDQPYSSLST